MLHVNGLVSDASGLLFCIAEPVLSPHYGGIMPLFAAAQRNSRLYVSCVFQRMTDFARDESLMPLKQIEILQRGSRSGCLASSSHWRGGRRGDVTGETLRPRGCWCWVLIRWTERKLGERANFSLTRLRRGSVGHAGQQRLAANPSRANM